MSSVEPAASPSAPASRNAGGTVARNAALLVIAQAVGTPLGMAVYMIMSYRLGAVAMGSLYQAQVYAGFGFLFVEWGLGGVIPARVAQDRGRAGEYLGSALAWRIGSAPIAAGLTALVTLILHRVFGFTALDGAFQISLALVCLTSALTLVWRTCGDAVRGLERAELAAYSHVGWQLANAALMLPALLLTGRLHPVLIAGVLSSAIVLVVVWRAIRRANLGHLSSSVEATKRLLREGNPFLVLSLILTLQPIVDTLYLSRLASEETMGWHAAATKLIQALIIPALSLGGALYPTLCRLYVENMDEYLRIARGAVRTSIAMVLPLAIGCFAYPDVGIRLFNRTSFGPAEHNLKILSVFIFLVYLTMVIGSFLAAAGKQRPWSVVQFFCIVISVVGDPILIPIFREWPRFANGGMGVAVTKTVSEILMLGVGIWMAPAGIFDRSVAKTLGQALVAGAAMGGVAWLLWGRITPFLAAPVSVAAYAGVLVAVGGVQEEQRAMIRRKLARFRRRSA